MLALGSAGPLRGRARDKHKVLVIDQVKKFPN